MDFTTSILLIACVIAVTAVGGKIGLKWVGLRALDPKITREREKRLLDEIEDLKEDVKKWRGAFNRSKQLPTVEVDSMPTDDAGLQSLIAENLPGIANALPPQIGKLLLRNPDKVFEFVKSNPGIIEKFLNIKGTQGQPAPDVGGIPQFNPKDAV